MNNKTIFVLGAGASKELNLPTGAELKERISRFLNFRFERFDRRPKSGDGCIFDALSSHVRETGEDINFYLHAAQHISEAMPQTTSIDQFINTQKDDERIAFCGKLAIVRSILGAERSSLLYYAPPANRINIRKLEETWLRPLNQLLFQDCGKDDLEERFNSVIFVVFNYDRCLEQFLYHALQNYYRLSTEKTIEIFRKIKIYHPYGTVGSLPLIGTDGQTPFGEEPHAERLLSMANNIKTFTEGTDPKSSEIIEIRSHMRSANKVVFLGFAFHPLNMELLAPNNIDDGHSSIMCFATALDISKSDRAIIEHQVKRLYGNGNKIRVNLEDLTCTALFSEYWRSLTF